jgi:thioredoxin 1
MSLEEGIHMSTKKERNMEKRIKKQMREEATRKRGKMMPILFGAVVVVIMLIIGGTVMSNSYDSSKQTAASITNLYKNEITPEQLKAKNEKKEEVYAYFYQPTCEHCKIVSPIVIPMAEGLNKPLLPVNIEKAAEPWKQYNIPGTPTMIHFKDGKEVGRIEGEHPESDFRDFLTK